MKLFKDIYYIVKYRPKNVEIKIVNKGIYKHVDTIKLENNVLYINKKSSSYEIDIKKLVNIERDYFFYRNYFLHNNIYNCFRPKYKYLRIFYIDNNKIKKLFFIISVKKIFHKEEYLTNIEDVEKLISCFEEKSIELNTIIGGEKKDYVEIRSEDENKALEELLTRNKMQRIVNTNIEALAMAIFAMFVTIAYFLTGLIIKHNQ